MRAYFGIWKLVRAYMGLNFSPFSLDFIHRKISIYISIYIAVDTA